MIKQAQRDAINRNPNMAAATLVRCSGRGHAFRRRKTRGGAMNAFIGMGMASNAGGANAQSLFAMGQQQAQQPVQAAAPAENTWKCACGTVASGNFCPECGAKRPDDGWKCSCGQINKGKFCSNCGATKSPRGEPLYKCDKCGWEPEDPKNPPKFCPECRGPLTTKTFVRRSADGNNTRI